MRTSAVCLCFLVSIALPAVAPAHETDQFTVPPGRNFADLGEYLNRWAYSAIEHGRSVANARIREAIDRHAPPEEVAELQSPERVTLAVREQWPWSVSQIEKFEDVLAAPQMKRKYPGRIVAYQDRIGGIYQFAFLPFDLRGLSHVAFFSSTIKVYGVYMGTDKLGHFTDEGIEYYYKWLAARQAGKPEREAVAEAVRAGTEGFMSEAGMLGMLGNADYSNGDLSANFAGFLFYRNLTERMQLKGQWYEPMLRREGAYWVTGRDVGPESPFFARFISEHLDEALNPGLFDTYMRPALSRAVADRAGIILEHYADESGNRRTRAWFDAKLAELSTYWGIDYGHRGSYDELASIGACCFAGKDDRKAVLVGSHVQSAKFLSALPPHENSGRERKVKFVNSVVTRRDAKDRGRDAFGRNVLHDAALHGTPDEVEERLKDGADPRTTDDYGTTPLHLACRRGSVAIARLLLDGGADVNAANESGTTPMHEAASSGEMDLVQLLLERGARVGVRDVRDQSPAQIARSHGYQGLFEALTSIQSR